MSLPNVNEWEKRPDWKEIARSIPCPACGATVVHAVSNVGSVGIISMPVPAQEQKRIVIPGVTSIRRAN